MSWVDKAKVNDVLLYCDEWRSRQDIATKFELSPVQSWHCVRYIAKLKHCIMVQQKSGLRKRAYMFKTRLVELKNIREERGL